jgi:hypothetical protein
MEFGFLQDFYFKILCNLEYYFAKKRKPSSRIGLFWLQMWINLQNINWIIILESLCMKIRTHVNRNMTEKFFLWGKIMEPNCFQHFVYSEATDFWLPTRYPIIAAQLFPRLLEGDKRQLWILRLCRNEKSILFTFYFFRGFF